MTIRACRLFGVCIFAMLTLPPQHSGALTILPPPSKPHVDSEPARIHALGATRDGHLYLKVKQRFYLTSDGGKHWREVAPAVATALPGPGQTLNESTGSLPIKVGPAWYACQVNLRASRDGGKSWQLVDKPDTPAKECYGLVRVGPRLIRAARNGVFDSHDGVKWRLLAARPADKGPFELLAGHGRNVLFVNGWDAQSIIHASDDGGRTWTELPDARGKSILGRTSMGLLARVDVLPSGQPALPALLYRSKDEGRHWTAWDQGLARAFPPRFRNDGMQRQPTVLLSTQGPRGVVYIATMADLYQRGPNDRAWRPVPLPAGVELGR